MLASKPGEAAAEGDLRVLEEFAARLAAASRTPVVTPALVVINVLVFILMAVDGAGIMQPNPEVAVRWGSNFGPMTADGQWWRLLTATFIHFGLIHLAFNMYALLQSGATAERLYGRGRFLVLYLFAGLTGSLASMLWNPSVNSAGASGAIFGVFGGLLAFVLNPRNGVPARVMTEHRNSTLLFAGYSLFYGAVHPNIDNAAHLGGLAGGFLMGLLLARPVDAAVRARPDWGRLAAGAAVGVAVLGLMVAAAMHPAEAVRNERAYQVFLHEFGAREDRAVALMNQANETLAYPDRNEAFTRLMQASAAEWEALGKQARAITLPEDSPNQRQHELLLRYFDARARLTRLAPLAASGDPAANAAAKQAAGEAEQALAALQ